TQVGVPGVIGDAVLDDEARGRAEVPAGELAAAHRRVGDPNLGPEACEGQFIQRHAREHPPGSLDPGPALLGQTPARQQLAVTVSVGSFMPSSHTVVWLSISTATEPGTVSGRSGASVSSAPRRWSRSAAHSPTLTIKAAATVARSGDLRTRRASRRGQAGDE